MYTADKIIPFTYVISTTLVGSASIVIPLTLDGDSSFELMKIIGSSSQSAAHPLSFSVLITDHTTSRPLSNNSQRIPDRLLFTSAYIAGGVEKYPIRFPALANILFDILDLSGSTNVIDLALKGYKLFQ